MNKRTLFGRMVKAASAALLWSMFCVPASAAALLRCEATYAGSTHTLETLPGNDPYTTESVDINGRFRFKAVVLGTAQKIEVVKLYVYYETRRQPVLLEEAKYLPPFAGGDSPYALTGLHSVYSPPLGRELQYGCALREVKS
ncbi:MAG: hypothetical protein P4L91_00105 [Burkholderiaceae bacterium]|nr:hypothetical protein [Burkholderiaceae bacterium]